MYGVGGGITGYRALAQGAVVGDTLYRKGEETRFRNNARYGATIMDGEVDREALVNVLLHRHGRGWRAARIGKGIHHLYLP